MPGSGRAGVESLIVAVVALVPACLVGSHVASVPDAAHDAAVARVLGLDPQPWRALDVAVGALLLPARPFTHATHAALAAFGGALVVAATAVVIYRVTAALLAACADARGLRFFVAAIASVTPLVTAPWQIEGAAVGGSVTGALLILLPIALLARVARAPAAEPQALAGLPAVAVAIALAVGYEPLVGVCALAAVCAFVAAAGTRREPLVALARSEPAAMLTAALIGLAPLLVALLRTRAAGVPLGPALLDGWSGEHGAPPRVAVTLSSFVHVELGIVLALLAVGGSALAAFVPGARPLAAALVAVAVLGFTGSGIGVPLGPTRFGAPVLAALAAACALAGVGMQAIVRRVAEAKLPLARASAAMVVVLELVLPVDTADDALVRASTRWSGAAEAWDDAAWGSLPQSTVVLVGDARIYDRALAAQACGRLRPDLTIVPTAPRLAHGPRVWRALASDEALIPLWRDLELVGVPGEAALSSLASVRPLAVAYEPAWGKAIGKHLVPMVLFDLFEPEPRGVSDRRRALEATAPAREKLARAIGDDPELTAAAATLLGARAALFAALGTDPELVARADADRRAFGVAGGRDAPPRSPPSPAVPSVLPASPAR